MSIYSGVNLLISLVGYRAASALALASTGRTVARRVIPIAIRTLCGPLAPFVTDNMVNPIVDGILDQCIPSPMVILRNQLRNSVVVVVVSGLKKGRDRILIVVKGIYNRVKNLVDPDQFATLNVNGTLQQNLIEDYQPTHTGPSNSSPPQIDPATTDSISAIVLEFSPDDLDTIVNHFEGQKIEMTKDQFQDYISQHYSNNIETSIIDNLLDNNPQDSEWVSASVLIDDSQSENLETDDDWVKI